MEKQTKIDRISNLPWDVLDTILVHLPIRDATRTSVLSSKWRYKWTGLSQFVFDDKCFPSTLSDKVARWGEIMKVIYPVLSNHSGPIVKFKLAAYCRPNYSDLDQWILFLTQKGIKEFVLQEFDFIKRYKLPPCLFSCPQLCRLALYGCVFNVPPTFKGFNCLASLQLTQVSIDSDTLESLIVNCPVLERLILLDIDHLTCFKIHNLNLKYLKVKSAFEDISLENSPLLASVDICLIPVKFRRVMPRGIEQGQACNLVRVLGCLPGIERLTLSGLFFEFLACNNVPERLPTMFNHLVALDLKEVHFDSLSEVMVSLSILKSCPNLEELIISVGHSDDSRPVVEFLKAQYLSDCFFNRLQVVRMRGILGTRPEWEFIKFILCRSPVLETMTIVKYRGERVPESLLLQVERASQHAKIICLTL